MTEEKTDQRKHRPPHAAFKILEMIRLGKHVEAQTCTDENVDFYHEKIREQQDLFVLAQCKRMGLEPNRDNLFATAINAPKRKLSPRRASDTVDRLTAS